MKFELYSLQDVKDIIITMDMHPLGASLFTVSLLIAAVCVVVVCWQCKR
jgi:hypothetical protein